MYINPYSSAKMSHSAKDSAAPSSSGSGSTSSTDTSDGSTSLLGSASDTANEFLSMLVTELQTQDPTAPMDPTQMVDQLVQFNMLGELISINNLIANGASVTSTQQS